VTVLVLSWLTSGSSIISNQLEAGLIMKRVMKSVLDPAKP
jgi:hypothetical protein